MLDEEMEQHVVELAARGVGTSVPCLEPVYDGQRFLGDLCWRLKNGEVLVSLRHVDLSRRV